MASKCPPGIISLAGVLGEYRFRDEVRERRGFVEPQGSNCGHCRRDHGVFLENEAVASRSGVRIMSIVSRQGTLGLENAWILPLAMRWERCLELELWQERDFACRLGGGQTSFQHQLKTNNTQQQHSRVLRGRSSREIILSLTDCSLYRSYFANTLCAERVPDQNLLVRAL